MTIEGNEHTHTPTHARTHAHTRMKTTEVSKYSGPSNAKQISECATLKLLRN